MNPQTQRSSMQGPAGNLALAIDDVDAGAGPAKGVAIICHPHPVHGGTMDNKVAQTLARACAQAGWRSVRFNFRGVGASAGAWDEGRGEVDDAMAVLQAHAAPGSTVLVAGFSFGGYVAATVAERAAATHQVAQVVLVGPATQTFTVPPVPQHTLVVHGEHDDVVPLAATMDWARPQVLPVVVVPAGGHFFHGQLGLLKQLVVRHLTGVT
jgi:uncharacterized protein